MNNTITAFEKITLRDQFAMAALPHIIQLRIAAAVDGHCTLSPDGIAEDAYCQADAMLAQRSK